MSFWKRIAVLSIIFVLLAVSVAPAFAAGEVSFEIRNRTETPVNLILRGPTDLDVTVKAGDSSVRLIPGFYDYRYFACGRTRRGSFSFSGTGHFLLLRKCEKGVYSTIDVVNLTGHAFALDLFGTHHYALTIKPGNNKLKIFASVYQYSTNACGPIKKGTARLKSGHNPDWVFDC